MKILAINPGSTSTKIAVYTDDTLYKESIVHKRDLINQFSDIYDQKDFRFECISTLLAEKGWDNISFDAFVGRGGFIKPVEGGVYEVNAQMLEDLKIGLGGVHACNLGGVLANMFALKENKPAYIVDPVVIDEMAAVAKVSGMAGVERKSFFHALNQKAIAREVAESINKKYEDLNLIVAHLGGGISVGAHQNGRVVDVNNALSGDGPFSPERSGGLPVNGICELIKKNNYTPDELINAISRKGGVYSYTGTVDIQELEKKHHNDDIKATAILDAMIYQIVKEIGGLAAILGGDVDGIILTGGIAFSTLITNRIKEKTGFIADVFVKPGEFEMEALVEGAKRILSGSEQAKEYM